MYNSGEYVTGCQIKATSLSIFVVYHHRAHSTNNPVVKNSALTPVTTHAHAHGDTPRARMRHGCTPPPKCIHMWRHVNIWSYGCVDWARVNKKLACWLDFHVLRYPCARDFLNGLKNLSFMTTARWFFQVNMLALNTFSSINTEKYLCNCETSLVWLTYRRVRHVVTISGVKCFLMR